MDSSFAITGKGYVIAAADMTASRSIVKMQSNEDKIKILGSHLLMAFSGEPGKQFDSVSQLIRLQSLAWGIFYLNDQTGMQAIPSNSPNMSNVTSVSLISATPTPFHLPLPPPGFAVSWQTLCVPDHLMPSTCLWRGTISLPTSRNSTGLIIWGRWLLCRSLLTGTEVISL